MVGGTLRELRDRITAAHEDGGRYYVRCARTGERPVPVAGKRFPDRETAVEAADLAASYRAELRQYDPRLTHHDLIVSEFPDERGIVDPAPLAEPFADRAADADFRHSVAAAVFEALSAHDETAAERAVMDAYLHSAESVTDRDGLCALLLSTMAAELDEQLSPARQQRVLRTAADRLGPAAKGSGRVREALAQFEEVGFLSGHDVEPVETVGDPRSWRVVVEGYALDGGDRLATLPLVVELLRHRPDETIAVEEARRLNDRSVQLAVVAGADSPSGVVSAELAD